MGDLWILLLAAAAVVVMIWVVRARHRGHGAELQETAREYCCEHLRPALEALLARGHRVTRAGQKHPELPLEIHLAPAFDAGAIKEELKLEEPVFVSAERHVLFCKEDWCELHPKP